MTDEQIIEMAKQAHVGSKTWVDIYSDQITVGEVRDFLKAFAKLVAQHEREKSLQLWMLLDDVDTADDIAKADHDVYRSLCRQAHEKRWSVLAGDEVDAAIRARGEA